MPRESVVRHLPRDHEFMGSNLLGFYSSLSISLISPLSHHWFLSFKVFTGFCHRQTKLNENVICQKFIIAWRLEVWTQSRGTSFILYWLDVIIYSPANYVSWYKYGLKHLRCSAFSALILLFWSSRSAPTFRPGNAILRSRKSARRSPPRSATTSRTKCASPFPERRWRAVHLFETSSWNTQWYLVGKTKALIGYSSDGLKFWLGTL